MNRAMIIITSQAERDKATRWASCAVPECTSNAHWSAKGGKGYCARHLYRLQRHGDPLAGRIAPGEAERYLRDVVLAHEKDECLLWPYARNSSGYGNIKLDGSFQLVHRVACAAENGPPPTPEHEAAHSCGNGHLGCCAKKHVTWKTSLENAADMVDHGRSMQGERHYGAKLTEDDVRMIRSSKASNADLARQLGVNPTNIIAVRKMKSWRHVT